MAGVLLNLLLGLSRVLLAMARRHEMPTSLDFVSEATSSPSRAVWAVGAVVAALSCSLRQRHGRHGGVSAVRHGMPAMHRAFDGWPGGSKKVTANEMGPVPA